METADWRRIDVDQYDQELQWEHVSLHTTTSYTTAEMEQLGAQLSQGFTAILPQVVAMTPWGQQGAVRDTYAKVAFALLTGVRIGEIKSTVAALSAENAQWVVSACYGLMAQEWALDKAGVLLVWIEESIARFGEGLVVRHLSGEAIV